MATVSSVFDQPGAGFVLLPAGIKYPPLENEWQKHPHTFQEAKAHKGNVGVMAGNGYIGLDQDAPAAFEGLQLPITTTWETRPGRLGMWFRCNDRTPEVLAKYRKKADQAQLKLFKDGKPCGEVKLERTYQVIPPSWKTLDDDSRADYRLLQEVPPTEVSLAWLLQELQRIGITFHSNLKQNVAKLEGMGREGRKKRAESDEKKARRYAEAALKGEVEKVRSAPEGHRNDQLNNSAFTLGRFVDAGILSESEVTQALESVAEDGEPEKILRTIRSGLEAGARQPMEIPERTTHGNRDAVIELKEIADIKYDENGEMKKARLSPTRAARAVLEKIPLRMSGDSEDIHRFDGQIYRPDGARMIDLALCAAAGDHVTGEKLRETLRRIKNELLESPVTFDPDPCLLGVKNGVANLLTGEVRDYRPEDLILDQIPVTFDASARCPAFLAFLESITPNVNDRITLIDWFAATAIKEPLPYVLFLLGLGRNGKGIYEKLIKKFFGPASFRDMALHEVTKNNFAAGGFYRKRGWIASETGTKKAAIGTDFMKLTSGNGVIDGDRKNQSRIQFEPYFQTIVDTNTMPQIVDNSIGWQERFVKVDLPHIFVANPDDANPLERKRDPAMFEKLSTPGELSGILNLLLFRSQAIGKTKTIHKRAGGEMFAEYQAQSSSVATFLELFCEYDGNLSGLWTPSKPIYDAYVEWCKYKVGEIVDKSYFGRLLKKFCGGFAPKQGKDKDRKTQTEYKGLIFDQNKYQSVMSEECLKMSEVVSDVDNVQEISMSEVAEANLWNDIIGKFGELPRKSPHEKEDAKIPQIPQTPQTSAASEPVDGKPASDVPQILPQTEHHEQPKNPAVFPSEAGRSNTESSEVCKSLLRPTSSLTLTMHEEESKDREKVENRVWDEVGRSNVESSKVCYVQGGPENFSQSSDATQEQNDTDGPRTGKIDRPTPIYGKVLVRILAKDGYRTQIIDPENAFHYIDHTYPCGEEIAVDGWKARQLIDRGAAAVV